MDNQPSNGGTAGANGQENSTPEPAMAARPRRAWEEMGVLGGDVILAGRYKLGPLLGEGSLGSAWLAEDLRFDGWQVVLQMVPQALEGRKSLYRRVEEAARAAMRLLHLNIARTRGFEDAEGTPFAVADYIEGRRLDTILADKGRLTAEETLMALGPVAAALDYAHGMGVLHRDVRPGNVIVRKDGTPFVRDFGISRAIQEALAARGGGTPQVGPPAFMSPEQLQGRTPDAAQDVYSFAAMAYECLTGHPPFGPEDSEMQILARPPAPIPEECAGFALRSGIMAGLSKDPEKRPESCAAVLEGRLPAERKTPPAVPETPAVREVETPEPAGQNAPAGGGTRSADAAGERVRGPQGASSGNGWGWGWIAVPLLLAGIGVGWWLGGRGGGPSALLPADVPPEAASPGGGDGGGAPAAEGRQPEMAEIALPADGAPSEVPHEASGPGTPAGGTKTITLPGGVKMELVWCPPGSFTMGSQADVAGRHADAVPHRVTLTRGFWIAKTEVTQKQWEGVMGRNPSHSKCAIFPVENVSWGDCVEFCRKAGNGLRLPTEAEWEYACRAGNQGAYGGMGNLDAMGWFEGNSGGRVHPVGQLGSNAWGMLDMLGNAWEWCADWYGAYPSGAVADPTGPAAGSFRVLRGGGWNSPAVDCLASRRNGRSPVEASGVFGFRPCTSGEGSR